MKMFKNFSALSIAMAACLIVPGTLAAETPAKTQVEVIENSSTDDHLASLEIDLKAGEVGIYDLALPVVVIVDQEEHLTHIVQYQSDKLVEILSVKNSTGKPSTPTPNGRSLITMKESNPSWKPPRSIDPRQIVVPPYTKTHKNPLGPANLRLSIDGGMIALHGTNQPRQIGKFVSHGCVRHLNGDILKVAKLVKVGTPVYIVPTLAKALINPEDLLPVRDANSTAHSADVALANRSTLFRLVEVSRADQHGQTAHASI